METAILAIILGGYIVLSVWGYRVAAEQAREDSLQGKRDANN